MISSSLKTSNWLSEPDLGDAIPEISVMPWPAFPTDLMSIAIVVATQSSGSVLFHDWMYPSRMFFIDKLVSMGAQIVLCDPHRCIVQGPTTCIRGKSGKPGYPRRHGPGDCRPGSRWKINNPQCGSDRPGIRASR
jgi:hypothetical protein